MSVITINKNNFEEEVLKSEKIVLIDFWASWCGPCRMMSPVIDEIAEEMGENIKVGKINIDEEKELAIKYDVMSIPTFIVFKNGNEAGRSVGVQDKEEIKNMLK
jgi:thioredoxin 1